MLTKFVDAEVKFQNASNDLSYISIYSLGYKDHKNI